LKLEDGRARRHLAECLRRRTGLDREEALDLRSVSIEESFQHGRLVGVGDRYDTATIESRAALERDFARYARIARPGRVAARRDKIAVKILPLLRPRTWSNRM
jgi:hypothetical protein